MPLSDHLAVIILSGDDFEYVCPNCKQFRLCCDHPFKGCGNCGHEEVAAKAPGEFTDEELAKLRGTPE